MTVWVCCAGILWMADGSVSPWPNASLLITLTAIAIGTPYMIYRTIRQKTAAGMFRYSVSGAVVTWSGIGIASATRMISEPWLSDSMGSLVLLSFAPIVLCVITFWVLKTSVESAAKAQRDSDSPVPEKATIQKRVAVTTSASLLVVLCLAGCAGDAAVEPNLSVEQILIELDRVDSSVNPIPPDAMNGIAHAFASPDRDARVSAIVACGKSKLVPATMKDNLMHIAADDADPLARAAALQALHRPGRPTPTLSKVTNELRNDPQLGSIVDRLVKTR